MEISQYGKVAVLMGGTSNERDISFESGRAVLAALHKKNIVAEAFDPKKQVKGPRINVKKSKW